MKVPCIMAATVTPPGYDGRCVASVETYDDHTGEAGVAITFEVAAGHLPPHVRRDLVDAVFELPELRHSHHLRATMPLGDAELLTSLRAHCGHLNARAAGSTCLVDGDLG
jgi:hypothetical protein